jgi:hypothetical protein
MTTNNIPQLNLVDLIYDMSPRGDESELQFKLSPEKSPTPQLKPLRRSEFVEDLKAVLEGD